MQIKGAGGYFDNRIYELDQVTAWQIAKLSVAELGVQVDNIDEENFLIEGTAEKRVFSICVQKMDEETVQIIADIHKKVIQVYSWKAQNKEIKEFYERFEKKMREFSNYILCPHCKSKISSRVRFCPECGTPIQ